MRLRPLAGALELPFSTARRIEPIAMTVRFIRIS
jgi:hypothetical protein